MTLYRHFASKDELVAECLRQLSARRSRLGRQSPRASGDPQASCKPGWAWSTSTDEAREARCALANAAVELPEKDHPRGGHRESRPSIASGCPGCAATPASPSRSAWSDEIFLLIEAPASACKASAGGRSRLSPMLQAVIRGHGRNER